MTALDPSAIDFIHTYQHHQRWIYAWLCKKLGSSQDAADLTQDTFVKLLQKSEPLTIAEPRAYLTTIAHGLMVNHIRRRDIERAYLEEVAHFSPAAAPSEESRAMALELLIKIDTLLGGLPYKTQKAFLLSQVDGLTHAQIAADLRISVASVRLYIKKALLHCVALQQASIC
ncbi:sigma-70 family RNA polymerase sigma factor [Methylotenera sp. N17]|uniref:sigma-70 family RNA polymerase sigma factor n=1 Tax=Methylotenera sp. N17 TaxID=1502761 RepID=UPI000645D9B7|nr:sigma-70 family RNA polymerase sigma factor [Methylotenera sp. N17]